MKTNSLSVTGIIVEGWSGIRGTPVPDRDKTTDGLGLVDRYLQELFVPTYSFISQSGNWF